MITLRKALFSLGLAVVSLCAFGQNATAAPIIIDNFTSSPGVFNAPVLGPTVLQGPVAIGGGVTRTLSISAPGLVFAADGVGIGAGTFAAGTLAAPTSTTLAYSFAPLVLSSASQLGMDFSFIDDGVAGSGTMSITLDVNTSTGLLSKTFTVPQGAFPQSLLVGLSGLVGPGNLNSTTGISLTFNSINDPGVDFIMNNNNGGIRIFGDPVPEPVTLATFGLMGLMGGFVARRKLARAATPA